MALTAGEVIEKLNLVSHPEGGFFRETYRSDETIPVEKLPSRYGTSREFSTSIYYLLAGDQKSNFHRLKSDEIWYFHLGSPMLIHCLTNESNYELIKLGSSLGENIFPQLIIKKGTWFAAEIEDKNTFSLIGCNVAPGFDYSDFELANRQMLINQFPLYEEIINKFTTK